MKKVNKFFGLMLIAGCSMGLATKVNAETGVCVAGNATAFENCAKSTTDRVIEVNSSYAISSDITVTDKRIAINNATLTISGTLTLDSFMPKSTDTDSYATGNTYNKLSNILMIGTSSELVISGTLNAVRTVSDNTLDADLITGWQTTSGTLAGKVTVNGGTLNVSGYEGTAIRCDELVLSGTGRYEVSNVSNATNTNKVTVQDNASINSHDNFNGLTTTDLIVKDNGKVETKNNDQHGIYADQATLDDNAVVESFGNHADSTQTYGSDIRIGASNDFEVKGSATLKAGTVSSNNSHQLKVSSDDVTLEVEDCDNGVFTAPTKMKGIVHAGNWVHVYTLDGDTVEISMEDSLGDGLVGVNNHTDKTIKVVTEDSSQVHEISANQTDTFNLVKITAVVDSKPVEGEVVVFKNQKFSELSKTGKNKLDTMLAKKGQYVNNYVYSGTKTALISDTIISADVTLEATYYIELTIGNYVFQVNPGTTLNDLSNADKAKLEAIKTSSTKKFMYFAVNGTAISETDTRFNENTSILVLFEGDAAPVVPDTPEDPDEPSKPDDGTTTTPGEEEKPPFSSGDGETTENPATGDNVMGSIAMGVAGLVGIVGSAVVFDKKTNYNN